MQKDREHTEQMMNEQNSQIADLRKGVAKLNDILTKGSNELEKLNKQRESEEKKEQTEEMKKTKVSIGKEKQQAWVTGIASTLSDKSAVHCDKKSAAKMVKVAPV